MLINLDKLRWVGLLLEKKHCRGNCRKIIRRLGLLSLEINLEINLVNLLRVTAVSIIDFIHHSGMAVLAAFAI